MKPDPPGKKILILAANPQKTARLRLDEEVREIEAGLQRAQRRDFFSLSQKWAVRPRDIQRAMLDINPHIVHFSGHGAGAQGLVFENDAGQPTHVDGPALAALFELFAEQVECIVLNGCYSQVQAEAIAQHIPYVVGMGQAIGDRAALAFAVGFYDALGAGSSVEFAYRLGCNAIQMDGIAEYPVPVLINKLGKQGTATPPTANAESPSESPSESSSVTAGERRRLATEREELQTQFEILSEEIQFLKTAERTDDLSPKAAFRLKKQITLATEERQQISQKLTALEERLSH